MKLSPIKDYRAPEYPTQEILAQHPGLLRALPQRWRNSPRVLGALAGLLALMEHSPALAQDKQTLHAAPIFEHGKGLGAFGCVMVSPPVFLTEAEAREVIEAEAKKAGVEFTERGRKLNQVPIPFLEKYIVWEDPKPAKPTNDAFIGGDSEWVTSFLSKIYRKRGPEQTREASLDVDVILTGWSPYKQIGYRFVAISDFDARKSEDVKHYEKLPNGKIAPISWISCHTGYSSVSDFDVHGVAQRLMRGLGKVTGSGTVGVFYDPLARASNPPPYPKILSAPPQNGKEQSKEEKEAQEQVQTKAWEEYRKTYDTATKAASEEELRLQVRDFLAWLKAQGVI